MLFLDNMESLHPSIGPLSAQISEHTALAGPSGAGKTTLFRALLGLAPCKGNMVLDDKMLTRNGKVLSYGPRRGLSMAWQEDRLLPHLTLSRNITLGSSKSAALDWCEMLCISHLMDKLPHEVSGGEAQRANLARALASSSRVVLLDEPFHGIDALMVRQLLLPVLERLSNEGRIVIMISHDIGCILGIFQQIMVMNARKLVFHGSAQDLYNNPANAWLAGFMGDYILLPQPQTSSTLEPAARRQCFVRPEWLTLDPDAMAKNATVVSALWKGATQRVWILLDGHDQPVPVETPCSLAIAKGERVYVAPQQVSRPGWVDP